MAKDHTKNDNLTLYGKLTDEPLMELHVHDYSNLDNELSLGTLKEQMKMKSDEELIDSLSNELGELSIRIDKLKGFLGTRHMRNGLDDFNVYLLEKQLKHMKAYRDDLKLRLKYAKSRKKEHEEQYEVD